MIRSDVMGVLFAIPLCAEHLDPIAERYIDVPALREAQFERLHGVRPDPRLTEVEFHLESSEVVQAWMRFRQVSRERQIDAQAEGRRPPAVVVLDDDEFEELFGVVPSGDVRPL